MDGPTYLAALRRRLADTDTTDQQFIDDDLWFATQDAVLELTVRSIPGYGTYTVAADNVSPEFTDADALITALQTILLVLTASYRGKVNRGELGGSWKSGLEEESTAAVQRALANTLEDLESDIQVLIIQRVRNTFATRVQ